MEKELQDEAAKKNAAIKVLWVVEFSRKGTKLDRFNSLKRKLFCFVNWHDVNLSKSAKI